MLTPVLLFGAYIGIGIVVAIALTMTDRKRGLGIIGDIAGLHAIGFFIFLVMWPLWLMMLWLSKASDPEERTGDTTKSADLEREPDE